MTFDEFRDKLRWIRGRGTAVFGLIIFAAFALTMYRQLDRDGKIRHTSRVDMRMTSNWIQNESRDCSADMFYDQASRLYVTHDMRCPNDVEPTEHHNIPVLFWGRIEREQIPMPYRSGETWAGGTMWRCVRKSDEFTCYAVN